MSNGKINVVKIILILLFKTKLYFRLACATYYTSKRIYIYIYIYLSILFFLRRRIRTARNTQVLLCTYCSSGS